MSQKRLEILHEALEDLKVGKHYHFNQRNYYTDAWVKNSNPKLGRFVRAGDIFFLADIEVQDDNKILLTVILKDEVLLMKIYFGELMPVEYTETTTLSTFKFSQ